MYVMNGRNEQVHVLDHATGEDSVELRPPRAHAGNFTHGHTIAVDSKVICISRKLDHGPQDSEIQLW